MSRRIERMHRAALRRMPTSVVFELTAEDLEGEYAARARYEAEVSLLRPGVAYRTETRRDPHTMAVTVTVRPEPGAAARGRS